MTRGNTNANIYTQNRKSIKYENGQRIPTLWHFIMFINPEFLFTFQQRNHLIQYHKQTPRWFAPEAVGQFNFVFDHSRECFLWLFSYFIREIITQTTPTHVFTSQSLLSIVRFGLDCNRIKKVNNKIIIITIKIRNPIWSNDVFYTQTIRFRSSFGHSTVEFIRHWYGYDGQSITWNNIRIKFYGLFGFLHEWQPIAFRSMDNKTNAYHKNEWTIWNRLMFLFPFRIIE